MIDDPSLTPETLQVMYGDQAKLCATPASQLTLVFSQHRPFDLVELEQLLEAVGWSRRPVRRVRKALDNSLIRVGLWRHDARIPRLVGFARCHCLMNTPSMWLQTMDELVGVRTRRFRCGQ